MGTTDVLSKVRALLAKAEATNFEAEAEAFTAKAQELIARHRIDRALLHADSDAGRGPTSRRIDVAKPYADAKVVLLSRVANANECRAVWLSDAGYSQLFGAADDLDAVEELYTSLLVQATAALQRIGPKQDAFGRSRTRAFRRAFLMAFAIRIGQRLRDTVDATVDAVSAQTSTAIVPLLAARGDAAEAAARAEFPFVRSMRPTVSDGEGVHAGRRFADQADLSVHRKVARSGAPAVNVGEASRRDTRPRRSA